MTYVDRLNAIDSACPTAVIGLIYAADEDILKLNAECLKLELEVARLAAENKEIRTMWLTMAREIVEMVKKFEKPEDQNVQQKS